MFHSCSICGKCTNAECKCWECGDFFFKKFIESYIKEDVNTFNYDRAMEHHQKHLFAFLYQDTHCRLTITVLGLQNLFGHTVAGRLQLKASSMIADEINDIRAYRSEHHSAS